MTIIYWILAQAQNEQFATVFNLEDYKGNLSSVPILVIAILDGCTY